MLRDKFYLFHFICQTVYSNMYGNESKSILWIHTQCKQKYLSEYNNKSFIKAKFFETKSERHIPQFESIFKFDVRENNALAL